MHTPNDDTDNKRSYTTAELAALLGLKDPSSYDTDSDTDSDTAS